MRSADVQVLLVLPVTTLLALLAAAVVEHEAMPGCLLPAAACMAVGPTGTFMGALVQLPRHMFKLFILQG